MGSRANGPAVGFDELAYMWVHHRLVVSGRPFGISGVEDLGMLRTDTDTTG